MALVSRKKRRVTSKRVCNSCILLKLECDGSLNCFRCSELDQECIYTTCNHNQQKGTCTRQDRVSTTRLYKTYDVTRKTNLADLKRQLNDKTDKVEYWRNMFMKQQRLERQKQTGFLWCIAKRLNITCYVSQWLQVYKERFASILAVPCRHWNSNYVVEAFDDSATQWRKHPETVELLGFLTIGAIECGRPSDAEYIYSTALRIITELQDITHPSIAIGKILLSDYTLLSGNQDFSLRNKGQEMIKTICASQVTEKKHIYTQQQIKDLMVISARLRRFTSNFMNDRVLELDNITKLSNDLSYIRKLENPTLTQVLMITWAICGKIWISISIVAPLISIQNNRIPLKSFKTLTEEETTQFLSELKYLERYKKIMYKARNRLDSTFKIITYLARTLTYFSGGMLDEAWQCARNILNILTEDSKGIRHPLVSLTIIFDICTIVIHLRDGELFVDLVTYLYSILDIDTVRPYISVLIGLAEETNLRYSKADILLKMLGLDPLKCPPSPSNTIETPPPSPGDINDER